MITDKLSYEKRPQALVCSDVFALRGSLHIRGGWFIAANNVVYAT